MPWIMGDEGWRSGELVRGSHLVLAALLGTAFGLPAIPFYSIGIFAPIFAEEFGWSFAAIFTGLAFLAGAILVVGPGLGPLVEKFGIRRVSTFSLCGLGLGFMSLAATNGSLVQYYLSWAVIALAGLGATPVMFTGVINAAFEKRRGIALGIALSGAGLSILIVKPLALWIIGLWGWRVAILMVGVLPLLVAAPVAYRALGRTPDGVRASSRIFGEAPLPGMTVPRALASRSFWLLAIVFVPMSLAVAAPLPNIENILRSLGRSPSEAVLIASIMGAAMMAGRLVGGLLIDRFWAPAVGSSILILAAIACFILSRDQVGFASALAAMILLGLAGGVEFDLMAYLVARYLGLRSYLTTYAILYGIFVVGAFAGPGLFGYVFDRTGSYASILGFCVILLLAGAITILMLGPYPSQPPNREDAV